MSIYDIQLADILGSYNLRRDLHKLLNEEFNKEGQIYGGRSFFTDFDLSGAVKTINFGGVNDTILPKESSFAFTPNKLKVKNQELPYGVNKLYKKLDQIGVNIQRRVLSKFYDSLIQKTDKALLDKFNKYKVDSINDAIMLSKELIYDVKEVKGFTKEARIIIKRAINSFKKEYKNKYRMMEKDNYLLSMDQLEAIGMHILGRSTELCPIETGFLRSSGTLLVFKDYIKIVYRCPYAVYVHENINMTHPFGQAKFLETAAKEILDKPVYVVIDSVSGEYANFEWEHYSDGKTSKDAYLVKRSSYETILFTLDRNLIINRSNTL